MLTGEEAAEAAGSRRHHSLEGDRRSKAANSRDRDGGGSRGAGGDAPEEDCLGEGEEEKASPPLLLSVAVLTG